jgi:hypothetical protein
VAGLEVLIELVLELLAQFFVEGLLDGAGRRSVRALRSPRRRRILAQTVSLVLAVVAGVAWGIYVARTGRERLPRAVWVSVTLAAVSTVLGVIARVRQLPDPGEKPGWAQFRRPDRWPWTRWAFFAVMSMLIAGALVAGYEVARPG